MSELFKRVLLVSGSLVFCLLGFEAYFRVFPVRDYQTNNEYLYREFLGTRKFGTPFHTWQERFPAEFDERGYFRKSDFIIRYDFNQFGARWTAPEDQKLEGKVIVVVGDSFTYGSAVRYGDTYVYQLQQRLSRPGRIVTLLNFAQSGADSRKCLQVYRNLQGKISHAALLYGLHLNDLIAFDTSYVLRNELLDSRYARNSKFAEFIVKRIYTHLGRRRKIQELTRPAIFEDPYFRDNMQAIIAMRDVARQNGVDFYVVLLPILIDVREETFRPIYDGIKRRLVETGVAYFDLTSSVKPYSDPQLWVLPVDQHPNEIAHDAFATSLVREIESQDLFE